MDLWINQNDKKFVFKHKDDNYLENKNDKYIIIFFLKLKNY